MTTNKSTRERGRAAPEKPEQPAGMLNMDELYNEVVADIQAAEVEVREKEAALAVARERLAAARGQMDLLGRMQRKAMEAQQ